MKTVRSIVGWLCWIGAALLFIGGFILLSVAEWLEDKNARAWS